MITEVTINIVDDDGDKTVKLRPRGIEVQGVLYPREMKLATEFHELLLRHNSIGRTRGRQTTSTENTRDKAASSPSHAVSAGSGERATD